MGVSVFRTVEGLQGFELHTLPGANMELSIGVSQKGQLRLFGKLVRHQCTCMTYKILGVSAGILLQTARDNAPERHVSSQLQSLAVPPPNY